MTRKSTVTVRLTVVLATATLVLAGCKGGEPKKATEQTLDERVTDAKKSIDDADYIGFTLETGALPEGLDQGLLSATGTGTHAPAFTGKIKADIPAIDLNSDLIAVDSKVYVELPFVGWQPVDPSEYGAPDPADLMDPGTGISSLLTNATGLAEDGEERDGETVLTTVSGTLAGDDVNAVFPSAGSEDFDVTFKLTDDNDLDAADITGPFYDGYDDVTYSLTLDLDADQVDIKAP